MGCALRASDGRSPLPSSVFSEILKTRAIGTPIGTLIGDAECLPIRATRVTRAMKKMMIMQMTKMIMMMIMMTTMTIMMMLMIMIAFIW